jgi:hypothetical protein
LKKRKVSVVRVELKRKKRVVLERSIDKVEKGSSKRVRQEKG